MKKMMAWVMALAMVLTLFGGCKKAEEAPLPVVKPAQSETNDRRFTIGWVSDPQWYSFKYFEHLTAQNDWIVENYDRLNMKYIVHTGDFVDLPHNHDQWAVATKEYQKWDDAGLAYGVLAGNHDVDGNDRTEYQQYFGTARYENNEWYGEGYDNNFGHYDLMTIGGVDFIFVYLGYGTHTQADYDWLNGVLDAHSDRIAMLAFHDYLNIAAVRSSTGEKLFQNVVLKNPNVRMVFCGHNYSATRRVDEIDDNGDGKADRTVYQMMANYQNIENGGNGFFRIMTFDLDAGTIASETYSPSLDRYNAFENSESVRDEYGYQDNFTIPFDFSKPTAKAATDPENGTVVVNSRVSFADANGTLFSAPVSYLNEAEAGASYGNIGVFDNTFSLTATDAFSDPRAIDYAVLSFSNDDGYRVERIVKGDSLGENDLVPIPRDGAVVTFGRNAVDRNGNAVGVDAVAVGQVVTFNQLYGHGKPVEREFPAHLTCAWGMSYGIHTLNDKVAGDQWVLLDGTVGDSAADAGD
ncbi:MAG: metallophosphoesterase, partial [Clostridia bacterium]|nr:metallophosphoesterase [Clostridia bacterium]